MLLRSAAAALLAAGVLCGAGCRGSNPPPKSKLVVYSLGSLQRFYAEYNPWFIRRWLRKTGQSIDIDQSFGPSGKATVEILRGDIRPDVIVMSHPAEIDRISRESGIVARDWRDAFPHAASPFYTPAVFVVRRGNPKRIADWSDLTSRSLSILLSNPKTCGGGRWMYTGILGFGLGAARGDAAKARKLLADFYRNVPVLYANQYEAGLDFIAGRGDVLVTYEAVALKLLNETLEIIAPSRTVKADIPVAVAVKYAAQNKTTELAAAYLQGLYDPEAQEMLARHHFRPRSAETRARASGAFPKISMFSREDVFGAGDALEKTHLGDGGIFDALSGR